MVFRRIVYFILLYAVFVYGVLYQTYDGFIMLVFFAAASLLSLSMLILSRLTLKYNFEEKTLYVQRTQEYTVRYHIKNVMPFPVTKVGILFDGLKKPQAFCVGAANTAIVTKKDVKEHCGCYFTGIEKIFLYDFFSVFRFNIKKPGVVKIVSLPRLFDINTDKYIQSMLYVENESDKIEINGSEVSQIREYRDGDSLKNIHHKLSSRMSRLMVKEYVCEDEDDDGFFFYDIDSVGTEIKDNILELMYNVMYLRITTKKAAKGYIMEGGMPVLYNITSKDMLDEYFEKIYEQDKCDDGAYIDMPAGTFVFAAAFSENLYNICSGLNGRKKDLVLYIPESEKMRCKNLDSEVIYVSAGGEKQ